LAFLLGEEATAFFAVGLGFSADAGEDSLLDLAASFGVARSGLHSAVIFHLQVGANFGAANGLGVLGSGIALLSGFNFSVTALWARGSR
jgi:hypothetical protein